MPRVSVWELIRQLAILGTERVCQLGGVIGSPSPLCMYIIHSRLTFTLDPEKMMIPAQIIDQNLQS